MNGLRTFVRWSSSALVPGEVLLMLCLAGGVGVPTAVRLAMEVAVLTVVVVTGVVLTADYRRHRETGLDQRSAVFATMAGTVPVVVRKLVGHELCLGTSFLRWAARRGPHGVRAGDIAVPYAGGQMALMFVVVFVSIVETVSLGFVIPWPIVRAVVLVLDLWGVYFILALHASCVVRPHLIGSDGSLRLRYGALLDIQIPAGHVVSARHERLHAASKAGPVDADGVADLPVAGETTVTVELAEPVGFARMLGRSAQARTFRFYADDPKATVTALRAHTATE